ncbi:MAG: NAD(P)-dependent oxidoreductase [Nitrospirota bacterium]|nr:NAD(P)-dependent oxidoreductase [Nitrospirota bacterium]
MKSEKVLITGCGGMLGSAVYPYFTKLYDDVLATDKDVNEKWLFKLDVRDHAHLDSIFKEFRPDLVLHLAAETDLEYCETHPEIAEATNSVATRKIAKLSEEYGTTLVYISTAGVFDGTKSDFYVETDKPNPIMVYGQTKYDGELHVLNNCSKAFVVRAGWMMGGGEAKEKKFIYKMLKQIGENKKELFAVNDLWGTPTCAYNFAQNLHALVETKQYGTYHMVCAGGGTRYDVAREILSICEIDDVELTPVSSDFFKEEYFVVRPPSERLANAGLDRIGCNLMRPWQDALRDYIETHFPSYVRSRIQA